MVTARSHRFKNPRTRQESAHLSVAALESRLTKLKLSAIQEAVKQERQKRVSSPASNFEVIGSSQAFNRMHSQEVLIEDGEGRVASSKVLEAYERGASSVA